MNVAVVPAGAASLADRLLHPAYDMLSLFVHVSLSCKLNGKHVHSWVPCFVRQQNNATVENAACSSSGLLDSKTASLV